MSRALSCGQVCATLALGNRGEGSCCHCAAPISFCFNFSGPTNQARPHLVLFDFRSTRLEHYSNRRLYSSIKEQVCYSQFKNAVSEIHSCRRAIVQKSADAAVD